MFGKFIARSFGNMWVKHTGSGVTKHYATVLAEVIHGQHHGPKVFRPLWRFKRLWENFTNSPDSNTRVVVYGKQYYNANELGLIQTTKTLWAEMDQVAALYNNTNKYGTIVQYKIVLWNITDNVVVPVGVDADADLGKIYVVGTDVVMCSNDLLKQWRIIMRESPR